MTEPYYADEWTTIWHGDCREVVSFLDDRFDAVVTDPPFNVGKEYGVSTDDLADEEYADLMRLVASCSPVQAWVTPTNRLSLFASLLGPAALPVVVRRGAKGPKRWGWFDQFDMVLVRGKPIRYVSNLWDDIRLKGEGYYFREETWGHPGYTPYLLLARLVGLVTELDAELLDPFMGTGTTLVAAKATGRRAVGIESNEAWCEVAASRLAQGVLV